MFDPARNWGLGLFSARLEQSLTLALGAFYAGVGPADLQGGDGSTIGFTGRITATPINADNGERLVHFGLGCPNGCPTTAARS